MARLGPDPLAVSPVGYSLLRRAEARVRPAKLKINICNMITHKTEPTDRGKRRREEEPPETQGSQEGGRSPTEQTVLTESMDELRDLAPEGYTLCEGTPQTITFGHQRDHLELIGPCTGCSLPEGPVTRGLLCTHCKAFQWEEEWKSQAPERRQYEEEVIASVSGGLALTLEHNVRMAERKEPTVAPTLRKRKPQAVPASPLDRALQLPVPHEFVDAKLEGDVIAGLDTWRAAGTVDPVNMDPRALLERSILWGSLSGAAPQPTSVENRRAMTRYEETEEARLRDLGREVDRVSETRRTNTERTYSSKGREETRSSETKTRARSHRLSGRAHKLAEEIGKKPHRIAGFFAVANKNRRWGIAVARILSRQKRQLLPGPALVKELRNCDDLTQSDAARLTNGIVSVVEVWASADDTPLVEDERVHKGEIPLQDIGLADDIDAASGDYITGCCKALGTAGTAADLLMANICPICVAMKARELPFTDIPMPEEEEEESRGGDKSLQAIAAMCRRAPASEGWIHAVARRHNKEQHAANGNIVFEHNSNDSREATSGAAAGLMWDKNTIVEPSTSEQNRLLEEAGTHQSVVAVQNYQVLVWQVPTENGTTHQLVMNWEDARVAWAGLHAADVFPGVGGEGEEGAQAIRDRDEAFAELTAALNVAIVHGGPGRRPRAGVLGLLGPVDAGRARELARRSTLRFLRGEAWDGWHAGLWIGVSLDPTYEHGFLTLSATGLRYKTEMEDDQQRGALINDQRAYNIYHFLSGCGSVAEAVAKGYKFGRTDFRELALRVHLYNRLRDPTFSQPTGVAYAVANKEPWEVARITTREVEDWDFKAITISIKTLEAYMRVGESVVVTPNPEEPAVHEHWVLSSPDVVVVGLDSNVPDRELGWGLWLLAHLRYPLGSVYETYRLRQVGRVDVDWATFARTAGLVSIPSEATKIIFLTNTETERVVRIGGVNLNVTTPRRFNELPAVPPPVIDANALVENCVTRILSYPHPLPPILERLVEGKLLGGINWLEIDNLSNILTVRFPRQLEGITSRNRLGQVVTSVSGAPPTALLDLFPGSRPAPGVEDWPGYDHRNAVNALDQLYAPRDVAEMYPALSIGQWTNIAEIGLCSGMLKYDTTNTERKEDIPTRTRTCQQDGKERAAYLRRAVEEWKRSQQLGDEHLQPGVFQRMADFWHELIYGTKPEEASLQMMARSWVGGSTLNWSWDMLRATNVAISLTGVRTSAEMWRTDMNTQLAHVPIESTCYALNTREGDWKQYTYQQVGSGVDEWRKERDLAKIDMLEIGNLFNFLVKPDETRMEGVVFKLYSTLFNTLYSNAGWKRKLVTPDQRAWAFGWGVHIAQSDWAREEYRVLGWARHVEQIVSGSQLVVGLWLQRGPASGPLSTAAAPRVHIRSGFRLASASEKPPDTGGVRAVRPSGSGEPPAPEQLAEKSVSEVRAPGSVQATPRTADGQGIVAPKGTAPSITGAETGGPLPGRGEQVALKPMTVAKPGTTQQKAEQNPDHRLRTDQ